MWSVFLASWQQPDGKFPVVRPTFSDTGGPPGCSIVILVARCQYSPQGHRVRSEGFARIYRFVSDGPSDYRLFNFVATPCPNHPTWLHYEFDVGYRGGDDGNGDCGVGMEEKCVHCAMVEKKGCYVVGANDFDGDEELKDTADSGYSVQVQRKGYCFGGVKRRRLSKD